MVVSDIGKNGKDGKDVVKRYDGEMEGEIVTAKDPRIGSDISKKGKGTVKHRSHFYEVEYQVG